MDKAIFSYIPIEVATDHRLTLRDIRVLIALYSYLSKKNKDVAWPTRATLATRCGYPETRISTITSRLVTLGWLDKEGSGGHSKSTRYRLMVPDLDATTVTESVTVTDPVTVTKPVTVTNMGTVTDLVTRARYQNGNPPVTKLVTGKEGTNEVTKEETKSSVARGARLQLEHPPDEWLVFCAEKRPDLSPNDTWDQFRDYWIAQPGQKGVKTDWFATWRNWVRNQKQQFSGKPSGAKPNATHSFDGKRYVGTPVEEIGWVD